MKYPNRIPPNRPPRPDTIADGTGWAVRGSGGVSSVAAREVMARFDRLNTEDARAAFADSFLRSTANNLNDTWVMIYELGRIIRDRKLYADPMHVGRTYGRTFTSFEEYWVGRMGKPFETWAELESVHHFAESAAPDLFKRSLVEARTAHQAAIAVRAQELAEKEPVAAKIGGKRDGAGRPKNGAVNDEKIQVSNEHLNAKLPGHSSERLVRRMKRDAPEIANDLAAGKYPSVRAAARAAGIVKAVDPVERIMRLVAKLDKKQRNKLLAALSLS